MMVGGACVEWELGPAGREGLTDEGLTCKLNCKWIRVLLQTAMADKPDFSPDTQPEKLDLSGLSSLSLGPDWVSGKPSRQSLPRDAYDAERPEGGRGPKGPRKDRRGAAVVRRRPEGDRRERSERFERPGREERPEPFAPVVDVDFYPEEEPFRVMAQAIRNSCRTFELFEIARLILEKPDRFVCVVKDPRQKEGEAALLYASVPDGLPFRNEEAAIAHTMRHYLGEFFEIEEVEVDPPSGSYPMVHKCGITGEVLSPPNYHRYQAICRAHHASKLAHLPYERFEQKLESSREEADIAAWMTRMKTQTRYTSKENPELVFTSLEDARLHLLTQARDKLVRPAYSARFSGKALALLNPGDPIRRSVEFRLEGQRRFPLDTANHLRGRLRRVHFAVYKRGSKGVSLVCAVKRRFRMPGEVLADNLSDLIGFLEAHPNFPAKDLPRTYLGIRPMKAKADPAAQKTAEEVASEMGAPEAADQAAKPVAQISPEDQARVRQLKIDLHYLVSEGYVTEYSDGRLYVPPVREEGAARKADEEDEPDEEVESVTASPMQAATETLESPVADAAVEAVPEAVPSADGSEPVAEDAAAVQEEALGSEPEAMVPAGADAQAVEAVLPAEADLVQPEAASNEPGQPEPVDVAEKAEAPAEPDVEAVSGDDAEDGGEPSSKEKTE